MNILINQLIYLNLFLSKLNIIHPKIESQKNYKINNLIEELKYSIINPSIEEISTAIMKN